MTENSNSAGSDQELIEQIKRERKEIGKQIYTSIVDVEVKERFKILVYLQDSDSLVKVTLIRGQVIRFTKSEYEMNKDRNPDFEKKTICSPVLEVAA